MAHTGDLLAEMPMRYGVTHVFGQPGGQTAALYDGIARRGPRLRHILVRDERSAAYAADAFACLTGRPGVCDVTVGPGTTKLSDGLVESRNASVPVIALVGELPRDWAPYREMGVASQGFDQHRFLSSITKSTLDVPTTAALPQMIRSAFRIATTGRPGPVAVVIPHDVMDADWDAGDTDVDADDRTRKRLLDAHGEALHHIAVMRPTPAESDATQQHFSDLGAEILMEGRIGETIRFYYLDTEPLKVIFESGTAHAVDLKPSRVYP